MMRTIPSIFLIALSFSVLAQKPPIKFGDVTMEEMNMKYYNKDSSASAVVLADYGVSSIEYSQNLGFNLIAERTTRIKIFKKDGYDWANFSIPLYINGSDEEKASGIKGVTYNLENGKIVETKMKNDALFKEEFDKNHTFLKGTLPNVKEGSVIEISYKVLSPFFVNFQDWEFQRTIPTLWSEYRAIIPEFFNYEKYMQGYVLLAINEHKTTAGTISLSYNERKSMGPSTFQYEKVDFKENRFRWVAQDVPAFKPEPNITTYLDYISKINFELSYTQFPNSAVKNYMGSWNDINRQYYESSDFGGEVTGNGFLKNIAEEAMAGKTEPEQKASAIYYFVKQNVEWNDSFRKFPSKSLRKVLDEKKGNSADINLLLASMLEKAGFTVSPVLISTRNHGFVRENIPVSTQFNSVICLLELGDKKFLLDATDRSLPMGVLPLQCLNGQGLVVGKDQFHWISLRSPTKSKTLVSAELFLGLEGDLKGKLTLDRTVYEASISRKKYFSKGEKDYIKEYIIDKKPWEISKSEFVNSKELNNSFKEIHDVEIKNHATAAGPTIYLNPFIMLRMEENPYKLEKREYPVDYANPFDQVYVFKLNIPEGYTVEELPKNKIFILPENAGRYSYSILQMGNTVNITSMFSINKPIFVQNEYPSLREFYSQIVAKQAEQIVLKKK